MSCFSTYLLTVAFMSLVTSQSSPQQCKLYYFKDETLDAGNPYSNVSGKHRQTPYYIEYEGSSAGCVCDSGWCLLKCCPQGQRAQSEEGCLEAENAASYTFTTYKLKEKVGTRKFHLVYAEHSECFSLGYTNTYLQENGTLYLEEDQMDLPKVQFCWDINEMGKQVQWECKYNGTKGFVQDTDQYERICGMIISMPFLLATFLVYALLPDRNLPAKALMCYVLSLLFAYILLVTIQLDSQLARTPCVTLAFFCYFFFMASFFWMNASCLDIFFTFSGIRGLLGDKKKENRRFMYYSAYAWGIPILMVGFAAIFTFQEEIENSNWHTGIGNGQCWFKNGWPTGIYFYFPIATLLIVNIVLFGVTTYKIKKVQHDTKMLKNVDSRKHRKYDNNDKQRDDTNSDLVYLTEIELSENLHSDTINMYDFLEEDSDCFSFNLYVKLLFAMGINWSMEVISWAIMWKWATVPDYVWVLTDFCNAVYGVFIFFIFVFKRNIWMMLKKRYLQFTGRPQQAHTLTSVNRTTVSQVSSSEA